MENIIENLKYNLCAKAFNQLVTDYNPYKFICLKDRKSIIKWSTLDTARHILGPKASKYDLIGRNSEDLCANKQQVKPLLDLDQQVIESEKEILLEGKVIPDAMPWQTYQVQGSMYPISINDGKPELALVIAETKVIPIRLDLSTVISMSFDELNLRLNRNSYFILCYGIMQKISRREIQCIVEMIKGKHAGQIAQTLQLKQSTVESYIKSLKEKLGATNKNSLLETVFREKILEQIVI